MGWRGLLLGAQDEQSRVQGVGVVQFTLTLHTCAPWMCKIITTLTPLLFSVILGVDYNAA